MKEYTVVVTQTETFKYHVDAETPQEAEELVLSGDYDPYASVGVSIDNVEVEE